MPKPVRVVNGSVSQTLDLKELFGVSFKKSESLKQKLAQSLIDKMKDRIAQGLDRFDEPMAPYSEIYKQSVDYIAARKNATVNMRLTGDMLGSLDLIETDGEKITIGFRSGTESKKAYDHMMGEGKLPVRQFFGVSDEDIEAVKNDFADELKILGEMGSTQVTEQNRASFQTLDELRRFIDSGRQFNVVRSRSDET